MTDEDVSRRPLVGGALDHHVDGEAAFRQQARPRGRREQATVVALVDRPHAAIGFAQQKAVVHRHPGGTGRDVLADIVVLFACRVLKELTHSTAFTLPIALATVVLGLIALYLAFAILVNSAAGRPVFAVPGPLFKATPPPVG